MSQDIKVYGSSRHALFGPKTVENAGSLNGVIATANLQNPYISISDISQYHYLPEGKTLSLDKGQDIVVVEFETFLSPQGDKSNLLRRAFTMQKDAVLMGPLVWKKREEEKNQSGLGDIALLYCMFVGVLLICCIKQPGFFGGLSAIFILTGLVFACIIKQDRVKQKNAVKKGIIGFFAPKKKYWA